MARQITDRGLPYYETITDPPDGASQQADLAQALDARMVTGEQAATLPAVPPARRLQWHAGSRTLFYSDGEQWWPVQGAPRRTVTGPTSLALTDTNAAVDVSSPSSVTLTIPPQSSVAWVDGTSIQVLQLGVGPVTVTPGNGVTLRADGDRRTTARRYVPLELQRLAADEWVLADLGGNAAADRLGELATFAVTPGAEWAPADGRRVTAATGWTALRAKLLDAGSPYGSDGGDPLLPDARGRALIGAGQGAGLSSRAAGAKLGAETHQLTVGQMPSHGHGFAGADEDFPPAASGNLAARMMRRIANWGPGGVNGGVQGAGSDEAHPNMQPSLVVPTYVRVLP